MTQTTMRLDASGEHRDVRGWSYTGTEQPKPFCLSQSEIIETLKGNMHIGRPYPLEQLIADIAALTHERLDVRHG